MPTNKYDQILADQAVEPETNKYDDILAEEKKESTVGKYVSSILTSMKDAIPDWALAPGESMLTIGTGIAGSVAGGAAALPLEVSNMSLKARFGEGYNKRYDTVGLIEDIQGKATYGVGYGRETTKETEALLGVVNYPLEKWSEHVAKKSGKTAQDLGAWPALAAGIETAVEFAPWLVLPAAYRRGRYGRKAHQKDSAAIDEQITAATIATAEPAPLASAMADILRPLDSIKSVVAPIGTGSPIAQAVVKNYTNSLAAVDVSLMRGFKESTLRFNLEQQKAMYDAAAADELSIVRRETPTAIDSLPLDMKNHARGVMAIHDGIAAQAVEAGILPYSKEGYVPRTIIQEMGPQFAERVYGTKAVKTATKRAKRRKYETVEETEAAAMELLGEDARVSRDFRQYHLVDAELMRAIAGKKLINEVRELGTELGVDTIKRYDGKLEPGFFRMENPAFSEARPQLKAYPEGEAGPKGGKARVRRDQDGDIVWDRSALQISKDFEGPLRAALEGNPNVVYRGIMQIKSAAMQAIMISPMMHGMVIWGKALPYQPIRGITFKNYRDGHIIESVRKDPAKSLKDNEWVRKETDGYFKTAADYQAFMFRTGHRPIGNMGWSQRMSDQMQAPSLSAGRSVVSRMVGYPAGLLGKTARTKSMQVIDAFGSFWHDKLLWDQVRASGYGMHMNIWRGLVKKGVDPEMAGYVASHMANRFTGTIPFEDMSAGTRAVMNTALFSKSFTGTNLGLYTDALRGLPRAVQNQIIHNSKAVVIGETKPVNQAVRSAAAATLVKDVVGMYILNAMTQSVIKTWQEGIDIEIAGILDGPEGEKFANIDREALMTEVNNQIQLYQDAAERYKSPATSIWNLAELSPNVVLNDPGKEHRVRMSTREDGTAEYIRIPVGKVGEDILKGATEPFELLMNKLSPTVGFVIDLGLNDKSGHKKYSIEVFNEDGTTFEKIGQMLKYFVQSHIANDALERAIETVQGDERAAKELAAQLAVGFSFSKGHPGGPALGLTAEAYRKLERKRKRVHREAKDLVEDGKYEEAIRILVIDGEETPVGATAWMLSRISPQAKMDERLKAFYKHATGVEREKMEAILRNEFDMEDK